MILTDSKARVRGVDSVPLIAHLLAVGGDGQPPGEQPAEGVEEDLPLIGGERPPDRVARGWAGGRHSARGGLIRLSRRSMAVLLEDDRVRLSQSASDKQGRHGDDRKLGRSRRG